MASSALCSICILAGGLSRRMGHDKARLSLGARTLLAQVRATAKRTDWPVRLVRRDLVLRCGPLGGIYTGLKTSRAEAELFLACDMPFVSLELMLALGDAFQAHRRPIFAAARGRAGFPCLIPASALNRVTRQLNGQVLSLQALAQALRARRLCLRGRAAEQLFNINTPQDWRRAQELWQQRQREERHRKATLRVR
jgi:molybdopterin-guanine dinucleotide biosynthesis protein A